MLSTQSTVITMTSLEAQGFIVAGRQVALHRFDAKLFISGSVLLLAAVATEVAIVHFTHILPAILSNSTASKAFVGTMWFGTAFALFFIAFGSFQAYQLKQDKSRPLSKPELELYFSNETTALETYEKNVSKTLKQEEKHHIDVTTLRQKMATIKETNQLPSSDLMMTELEELGEV